MVFIPKPYGFRTKTVLHLFRYLCALIHKMNERNGRNEKNDTRPEGGES